MEEEISTVNIVDKDEQHGSKGGILFMAGKLKIAMLGHKRIPSREGGIEIVAEELSARLVQLGHEVTCYNRRVITSAVQSLTASSYPSIRESRSGPFRR